MYALRKHVSGWPYLLAIHSSVESSSLSSAVSGVIKFWGPHENGDPGVGVNIVPP